MAPDLPRLPRTLGTSPLARRRPLFGRAIVSERRIAFRFRGYDRPGGERMDHDNLKEALLGSGRALERLLCHWQYSYVAPAPCGRV